jgi:hypothetical protein
LIKVIFCGVIARGENGSDGKIIAAEKFVVPVQILKLFKRTRIKL